MTRSKDRLTVTIDRSLLDAANAAVAEGRDSLSAWVNRAVAERLLKEQRLAALADAIGMYESQYGIISDAELTKQRRADRESSTVVRSAKRATPVPGLPRE